MTTPCISTSNAYIYSDVSLLFLIAEVCVTARDNQHYSFLEEALDRVFGFTFLLSHIVKTHQNTQDDLISNTHGVPQQFLHLNQDMIQYIKDKLENTIIQNSVLTAHYPDATIIQTHADRLTTSISLYVKYLNDNCDTPICCQAILATQLKQFTNACYIQNVTHQTFIIHMTIQNLFPTVMETNFFPENYNHITADFQRRFRTEDIIANPLPPRPQSILDITLLLHVIQEISRDITASQQQESNCLHDTRF